MLSLLPGSYGMPSYVVKIDDNLSYWSPGDMIHGKVEAPDAACRSLICTTKVHDTCLRPLCRRTAVLSSWGRG